MSFYIVAFVAVAAGVDGVGIDVVVVVVVC